MHENRAFPRYKVSIAGKLLSPDMSICVDIEIRDLSEDGAFVTASSSVILPDRVYLWEARKHTVFECTVRWQRLGRFFGLQFTDIQGRERRRALIDAATAPAHATRRQINELRTALELQRSRRPEGLAGPVLRSPAA